MKILCIGRGYIGKALSAFEGFDVISHQDFLSNEDVVVDYAGVVNCAGIVGHRNCDTAGYAAVLEANVGFPVKVANRCRASGIRFFQTSTIGMSLQQSSRRKGFSVDETMPVYPHNLYCASKMLAEQAVAGKQTVILRLPWVVVPGTFESRIHNWTSIQATFCSILELEDLRDILRNACEKRAVGVFHIKSRNVYFPDYIQAHFGLELPLRGEIPTAMTAAVPMDATLAKRVGLLNGRKDQEAPQ